MGPYKQISTLSQNVANLRFKVLLNEKIAEKILDGIIHFGPINIPRFRLIEKRYSRAIEMHTEGKAYKEMIQTLYFLDDDLNNDTYQQHISIERYFINAGFIDDKIEYLKDKSGLSLNIFSAFYSLQFLFIVLLKGYKYYLQHKKEKTELTIKNEQDQRAFIRFFLQHSSDTKQQ